MRPPTPLVLAVFAYAATALLATGQQTSPGPRIPSLDLPQRAERPAIGQVVSKATDAAEIVSVERIWSEAPHNGFTDLTRYGGRWYCAFREGSARVSTDGAIRVLTSADGVEWESAFYYAGSDVDLRDPKLSVTSERRLMLTAMAVVESASSRSYQTLSWYSTDGRNWGTPFKIVDPNVWLWRISWHLGSAFSMGYGTTADRYISLFTGPGGLRFRPLAERVYAADTPTEATLLINSDDTALCLLRRDAGTGTTLLGSSRPPYRGWEWRDLGVRLTAPNLIRLPDGRLVAAGGTGARNAKTTLYWLDEKDASLDELLTLPSGGDTGYPGLAYYDDLLWVSYHSSHKDGAAIYLAKIRLPAPNQD